MFYIIILGVLSYLFHYHFILTDKDSRYFIAEIIYKYESVVEGKSLSDIDNKSIDNDSYILIIKDVNSLEEDFIEVSAKDYSNLEVCDVIEYNKSKIKKMN